MKHTGRRENDFSVRGQLQRDLGAQDGPLRLREEGHRQRVLARLEPGGDAGRLEGRHVRLPARQVIGWPKRSKLAHTFL